MLPWRNREERLAAAMFRAGRGRNPSETELAQMVATRKAQPKPRKRSAKRRVVDVVTGLLPFSGRRPNGQ